MAAIAAGIYKGGEYEQPSTGVVEDGGQVIIRRDVCSDLATINQQEKIWSLLKEKGEEANMLYQFIS